MERKAIELIRKELPKHPFFRETGLKLTFEEGKTGLIPGGTEFPHLDIGVRVYRNHFADCEEALKLIGQVGQYFPEETKKEAAARIIRVVKKNYEDRQSDINEGMRLEEDDFHYGRDDLKATILQHIAIWVSRTLDADPRFKKVELVFRSAQKSGISFDPTKKNLDDAVKRMDLRPDLQLQILFGGENLVKELKRMRGEL